MSKNNAANAEPGGLQRKKKQIRRSHESSKFSETTNQLLNKSDFPQEEMDTGKKLIFKVEKNCTSEEKDEHKFKCNIENCCKNYNQKWLLERHLLCHLTGFRNFKCLHSGCEKIYKSKENMIFHYKNIHLRTKPFKCNFCASAFSHRNGKIYHERKKHPERLPFTCLHEACKFSFANETARDHHIKTLHKQGGTSL